MLLFIDVSVVILYLLFLGMLYLLISFVFDLQKSCRKIRTHRYIEGPPKFESLEGSEGIIKIKYNKLIFQKPDKKEILFSFSLNEINKVSTEDDVAEHSNKILNTCSKVISEDSYLFVDVKEGGENYTLKFSTHKMSPINKETKDKILKAKSKNRRKMKTISIILTFMLAATPVVAQESYDYGEDSPVEFDDTSKKDADFFDYGDGEEHDASIEDVDKDMGQIEVYDYDENRYRTVDTD